MLFAVVLGLCVGAAWVTGYTLLQETVADEFRGRTFSALNILSKLGLLATLAFFPTLAGVIGRHEVFNLDLSGTRVALIVAGASVVLGGLFTRVGLHRYRMQKPRPLGLIPRLRKPPPEGVFIAFEGVEGSGKGTQIEMLRAALEAEGREVLVTREPGGTELGERLREMLLAHSTGHLEPRTEALLFGAARAQVVATVIRPALEAGKVVLCDRYIDSSLAYQGVGRGVGEQDVLTLNVWATQGLFPDLVVLLHLEPEIGLERAGDPDRFEAEGVTFHAKVADAYLHIAEEHPERVVVVDAARSPAAVHDAVMDAVRRVVSPPPGGHA
jgi:dTMP kinase